MYSCCLKFDYDYDNGFFYRRSIILNKTLFYSMLLKDFYVNLKFRKLTIFNCEVGTSKVFKCIVELFLKVILWIQISKRISI